MFTKELTETERDQEQDSANLAAALFTKESGEMTKYWATVYFTRHQTRSSRAALMVLI